MQITHKSFPLKIQIKEDPANPEARTIEGWASTFGNKDSDNDIILPGAFAETLQTRKPKMLWQHNTTQPVGVWDSATETAQGLYVKGRILDTTLGNDVYKLAQAGAIDSMSIGYSTIDASYDYDTGTRTLKQLDLWEVSLVTFPANDQAKVTLVKAVADDVVQASDVLDQAIGICEAYQAGEMEPSPEAFGTVLQMMQQAQSLLVEPDDDGKSNELTPKRVERILCDAGISRKRARRIVSAGFNAGQCDADSDKSEIATLFNQFR